MTQLTYTASRSIFKLERELIKHYSQNDLDDIQVTRKRNQINNILGIIRKRVNKFMLNNKKKNWDWNQPTTN